jgi:hypothetical protein
LNSRSNGNSLCFSTYQPILRETEPTYAGRFHQGEAIRGDVTHPQHGQQGHRVSTDSDFPGEWDHGVEERSFAPVESSKWKVEAVPGETGFCIPEIKDGRFCGWLLLARVSETFYPAEGQCTVLA